MKNCPDCGYRNPGGWSKCEICGRDMAGVADFIPARKHVRRSRAAIWGLLCATAAALGFVYYLSRHAAAKTPARPAPQPSSQNPATEDAAQVIRNLAAPSPAVRAQSFETLGLWLENGVLELPEPQAYFFRGMEDSSYAVRAVAALRLAMLIETVRLRGGPESAWAVSDGFAAPLNAAVERLLAEPFEVVRENAAFLAGASRSKRLSPALRRVLRYDSDMMVRLAAAGALVKLGERDGVLFLVARAADPDENIRQATAQYLAYCEDDNAAAVLSDMSKDADESVRSSATAALETRKLIFEKRKI